MQRDELTVLISGAGIAGSTLAALLGRAGHRATVVERDQGDDRAAIRSMSAEVRTRLRSSSVSCRACRTPRPEYAS